MERLGVVSAMANDGTRLSSGPRHDHSTSERRKFTCPQPPLTTGVYGLFTKARMLLLTVIHAHRFHTRLELICLIRLFECIDVIANLHFGLGESDCDNHVAFDATNETKTLA
jgi:hypothetical protein